MKNEEKRKSRKSLVLLLAAFLLVLVFVLGGNTFAKYVSSTTTDVQNATVAKWGFVVTANTTKLFGEDYGNVDSTNKVATVVEAGSTGVVASADTTNKNIVAPGTSGSMTFSVVGSAEVNAKIEISIAEGYKDVYLKDAQTTPNTYNPVKWTLNKVTKTTTGTTTETLEDKSLQDIANLLSGSGTTVYQAGESVDVTYTLSWKWAFDGSQTDSLLVKDSTEKTTYTADEADTILGLYTADSEKNPLPNGWSAVNNISFTLNISVTQTQETATTTTS